MRASITRTLVESKISAYTVEMVEGKPVVKEVEPVTVFGKVTKESAAKELKRVYGKDSAVCVGEITETESTYEISVSDFVKHATKIEPKETETAAN